MSRQNVISRNVVSYVQHYADHISGERDQRVKAPGRWKLDTCTTKLLRPSPRTRSWWIRHKKLGFRHDGLWYKSVNPRSTRLLRKSDRSPTLLQPLSGQILTLLKTAAIPSSTFVQSTFRCQSEFDSCRFRSQADCDIWPVKSQPNFGTCTIKIYVSAARYQVADDSAYMISGEERQPVLSRHLYENIVTVVFRNF